MAGKAQSLVSVNRGSLISSTFYAIVISVLVSFGSVVFSVLVARNLSVRDFATFVAVLTFINLVGVVFSGFQVAAAREIAQGNATAGSSKFDKFTVSILLLACALAALMLLSAFWWNSKLGLPFGLVLSLALVLPSSALLIVLNGRLAGLGRFREQALVSLILVTLNIGFQLLALLLWGMNLERIFWIQIGINIVIGFSLVILTNKTSSVSQVAFTSQSVQTAVTVAFFGLISNFDVLLSPLVLSDEVRGHYSAAAGISKYMIIFFTMVNATFFTILNRNKASDRSSKRTIYLSGFLLALCCAGFVGITYLFGKTILMAMYGNHFSIAGEYLWFVALCTVPFVFASWLLQLVFMKINWFPGIFMAFMSILGILLAFTFGHSLVGISLVNGFSGLVVCISLFVFLFLRWRTNAPNAEKQPSEHINQL